MPLTRIAIALALAASTACARQDTPPQAPITVFAAASLARPLTAMSDTFQQRTRIPVLRELGGSLEQSRKITELGRVPDALLLVDDDVIAALMPNHIGWYVRFATNRLVVAVTSKSRRAAELTRDNWWQLLSRGDARVGRADPATAPAGRHALALLQRAETYYARPGLGDRLIAQAPLRFVRPNATELAALLETGEVDYIIDYESVARQYGFSFVELPADLAPPVLYGLSVPLQAAHTREGIRFAAFVLSDEGKRILRDASVNVLRVPVAMGANVPLEITELVRTITAGTEPR
jgi:molybdate/tungstate transport system substrate-binding protein